MGTLIQGSSCRSAWSSASPTLTAPLSPPPTWADCRLAVFWSSEAPPPGTADRRGCAAPWSRPKLSVSDFPRVPASPSHGVFPTQRLRPRAETGGNRRCGGRNAPDAEWLPSRSQGADRWVDAGYPLDGWPRQGNRKKGSCPILDFWWFCHKPKSCCGFGTAGRISPTTTQRSETWAATPAVRTELIRPIDSSCAYQAPRLLSTVPAQLARMAVGSGSQIPAVPGRPANPV